MEYGVPAGYAFQIMDDVLDCTSTREVLGKDPFTDIRQGTKTLILHHAVHQASTNTKAKLREIYSKNPASKTIEEIDFVAKVFLDTGSIKFAKAEAIRCTNEALKIFEDNSKEIPESEIKDIARDSLREVYKRKW